MFDCNVLIIKLYTSLLKHWKLNLYGGYGVEPKLLELSGFREMWGLEKKSSRDTRLNGAVFHCNSRS